MKQIQQLNLPCYKMEVSMSIEAWHFLHGTTNGVSNHFYFLSLLSMMKTQETFGRKRGQTYPVHAGQIDCSMIQLAMIWSVGRKAVTRLLDDFQKYGLVSIDSSRLTSLMNISCVMSWMTNGQVISNPLFISRIKNFKGVRLYFFNGQKFETIRRNNHRERMKRTFTDGKPFYKTTGIT